jgi:hypothetical protein
MNTYLAALSPDSQPTYLKTMETFVEFLDGNQPTLEDLSPYMDFLHENMKTSSMKTKLSILCAFFEFGLNQETKSVQKLIYRKFKQWEKSETTNKAKVKQKIIS